jgi:hypothetical protein
LFTGRTTATIRTKTINFETDWRRTVHSKQTPASDYGQVIAFLKSHSGELIEHQNGKVLPHLEGTFYLLYKWGNPVDLCLAGLCHAVYGTHDFKSSLVDVSLRSELRALIGPEAEEIVYFFASCDRAQLYPQIGRGSTIEFRDRFSGEVFVPDHALFRSFLELTFANELEIARANKNFVEYTRPSFEPLFRSCRGLVSDGAYAFFVEIYGLPPQHV